MSTKHGNIMVFFVRRRFNCCKHCASTEQHFREMLNKPQTVQKETALKTAMSQPQTAESHRGQIFTPHCQTSRLRFISFLNIYYSNIIFNVQPVTTKLLPHEAAQCFHRPACTCQCSIMLYGAHFIIITVIKVLS